MNQAEIRKRTIKRLIAAAILFASLAISAGIIIHDLAR